MSSMHTYAIYHMAIIPPSRDCEKFQLIYQYLLCM